jgi:proteic killer suppression protein
VITSFKDQVTEDVFHGVSSKKSLRIPRVLWANASRKLDMVNTAHDLMDLRIPPSNHLEGLKGDLEGFNSIRINDQLELFLNGPQEMLSKFRLWIITRRNYDSI